MKYKVDWAKNEIISCCNPIISCWVLVFLAEKMWLPWLDCLYLTSSITIDCSYFFIEQCSILCTVGMINRPEHFRLLASWFIVGLCLNLRRLPWTCRFPWFNIREYPCAPFFWNNSVWHFCLYDFFGIFLLPTNHCSIPMHAGWSEFWSHGCNSSRLKLTRTGV